MLLFFKFNWFRVGLLLCSYYAADGFKYDFLSIFLDEALFSGRYEKPHVVMIAKLKSKPYVNSIFTQVENQKLIIFTIHLLHFRYYCKYIQSKRIRRETHFFIGSLAQNCFTLLQYDQIAFWFYSCVLRFMRKFRDTRGYKIFI